jgi:hypothetical protein
LVTSTTEVTLPHPNTTSLLSVHVSPPIFNAKFAIPVVSGVPEMVYVRVPAPLAKIPADSVAVKPVTPVDDTV